MVEAADIDDHRSASWLKVLVTLGGSAAMSSAPLLVLPLVAGTATVVVVTGPRVMTWVPVRDVVGMLAAAAGGVELVDVGLAGVELVVVEGVDALVVESVAGPMRGIGAEVEVCALAIETGVNPAITISAPKEVPTSFRARRSVIALPSAGVSSHET